MKNNWQDGGLKLLPAGPTIAQCPLQFSRNLFIWANFTSARTSNSDSLISTPQALLALELSLFIPYLLYCFNCLNLKFIDVDGYSFPSAVNITAKAKGSRYYFKRKRLQRPSLVCELICTRNDLLFHFMG